MSLTKDDLTAIRGIFNEGFEELVLPRFDALDSRMDSLDSRMDGLDSRMDGLDSRMNAQEKATSNLREDMRAGFARVDERFDDVMKRLESLEEDVRQLYRDVDGLKTAPDDKRFRTLSVNDRLLRLHNEVVALAKERNVELPS